MCFKWIQDCGQFGSGQGIGVIWITGSSSTDGKTSSEQLLTSVKNRREEAPAAGGGNKMLPPGQMICMGSPIKTHTLFGLNVIIRVKLFDRVV